MYFSAISIGVFAYLVGGWMGWGCLALGYVVGLGTGLRYALDRLNNKP